MKICRELTLLQSLSDWVSLYWQIILYSTLWQKSRSKPELRWTQFCIVNIGLACWSKVCRFGSERFQGYRRYNIIYDRRGFSRGKILALHPGCPRFGSQLGHSYLDRGPPCFSSVPLGKCRDSTTIMAQELPSKSVAIHHSSMILPYDAIRSRCCKSVVK
jgi:hypothetical protein